MENDALIVARKIEMGRHLDTNEPAESESGAEMVIYWEGKKFRVTVEDLGPEA